MGIAAGVGGVYWFLPRDSKRRKFVLIRGLLSPESRAWWIAARDAFRFRNVEFVQDRVDSDLAKAYGARQTTLVYVEDEREVFRVTGELAALPAM